MNERTFEALTRRASLLAVAAAPTALASRLATAKKRRSDKKLKQARKACQQDLDACLAQEATCAAQVEDCETTLQLICAADPDCLANRFCCPLLESCDFPGFLNCLREID
jgi:hypothetical protein